MTGSSRPIALVTGASGLVGAHLVTVLLARGYRARVLAREPWRIQALAEAAPPGCAWRFEDIVAGDIRDPAVRRRAVAGIDLLFHACHSHEYWRPNAYVHGVNVAAAVALMEDVRRESPGCTVVFSSSTSTLKDPGTRYDPAAAERIPRRLFNSLTKLWAERAVERLAAETGLDVRYVHLPYVVGPLDLRPTPLRLAVAAALVVPLPAAPAGGCVVAGAAKGARAHVDLAEGGRPGEHVTVEGTGILYSDFARLANEAAGRAVRPVTIPPALLRLLALGTVFDRWAADRMSTVGFTAGATDPRRREELRAEVFAAAAWFREHRVLPGPGSLLRYVRRFL